MKFCNKINFIFFIRNVLSFRSDVNSLFLRQNVLFTFCGNYFANCSFTSLYDFLSYYHSITVTENLVKYLLPVYITYQSQIFVVSLFLKLFSIKKEEYNSFNDCLLISIASFLTEALKFKFYAPASIFSGIFKNF